MSTVEPNKHVLPLIAVFSSSVVTYVTSVNADQKSWVSLPFPIEKVA